MARAPCALLTVTASLDGVVVLTVPVLLTLTRPVVPIDRPGNGQLAKPAPVAPEGAWRAAGLVAGGVVGTVAPGLGAAPWWRT